MPPKRSGSRIEREIKAFALKRIPRFRPTTDAAAWRREVLRLRREALSKVFLRGYPRRIVDAAPRVVWGDTLRPNASYVIRKLRYEAYPNYWIPALLYEPAPATHGRTHDPLPVVLNPNGHHAGGKAVEYKQIRCINLARRGVLALSTEFIGMSELEADADHNNQGHVSLTGMAGVGLFYLALKKGLDVLLTHRSADRRRVGVTGLSGGGWQTVVLAALDPRVTLCCPVAGYTSLRPSGEWPNVGDLEQTPPDMTTVLDYPHLTAMLAPRPALMILNARDECCFKTATAKPVIYDPIVPTYRAFGAEDRFAFHSNLDPGTHNYGADNRSQLYKFLNRHFALDGPEHDIHREEEVLTEEELRVGLPVEQETMLTLALGRARALAAQRRLPRTAAQRRELRARVARVIDVQRYAVRAGAGGGGVRPGGERQWTLRLGPWTVPLTARAPAREIERASETATLLVRDAGRAKLKWSAYRQQTTFLADVICTGVSRIRHVHGMLIEATGARLLGIQVAQIHACAEFAARRAGVKRLRLEGDGLLAGTATLIAAALRPELFSHLRVTREIATLRYLMQWPLPCEAVQPLFCFGLLEVADIDEFKALLEHVVYDPAGREVKASVPRL